MDRPETPEQYMGTPSDLVLARRVSGFGAVRLEPNDRQPGMPACDCHPADPERPETSLGIIHEGDVITMTRAEAVGYFRTFSEHPENPDSPLTHAWNDGRADFEYVSETDGSNAYAPSAPSRRSSRSSSQAVTTFEPSPAVADQPQT